MRFTAVRALAYTIVMAAPAIAQPEIASTSMPRVEISIGADSMFAGAGRDLERTMVRLGLESASGRNHYPATYPPSLVPGVFLQVHAGTSAHTMLGVFVGADESTTLGRSPNGDSISVRTSVKTRALLASYRPAPWLRFAAGPSVIHRLLDFGNGQIVGGDTLGILAAADAKFARRPRTLTHPARFGYVTAQYRETPALDVPWMAVPLGNGPLRVVPWPTQRVRMSHWAIGLGVGFGI